MSASESGMLTVEYIQGIVGFKKFTDFVLEVAKHNRASKVDWTMWNDPRCGALVLVGRIALYGNKYEYRKMVPYYRMQTDVQAEEEVAREVQDIIKQLKEAVLAPFNHD